MKCRKGLHEMTEDNIRLDGQGRKHCRACIRKRKSSYRKGALGVGRHTDTAVNVHEREMAEALKKNQPVIEWRKKSGGVYIPVSVYDPFPDGEMNSAKTVCKWGHEFTEANTIVTPTGRQCRTCKYARRKPLTPEQKQQNLLAKRESRSRLREERRAA